MIVALPMYARFKSKHNHYIRSRQFCFYFENAALCALGPYRFRLSENQQHPSGGTI